MRPYEGSLEDARTRVAGSGKRLGGQRKHSRGSRKVVHSLLPRQLRDEATHYRRRTSPE